MGWSSRSVFALVPFELGLMICSVLACTDRLVIGYRSLLTLCNGMSLPSLFGVYFLPELYPDPLSQLDEENIGLTHGALTQRTATNYLASEKIQ